MEIMFKSAESEDISILIDFMREYYEYDRLAFDVRVARKALEEILNDDSAGNVWLIQGEGKDVCYIVLSFICSLESHGRAAFVDELYNIEGYRKRGIGVKALKFVEEFCRSRRIDAIRLEVERSNIRARAVYERFGFVPHDRFTMTRWLETKRLSLR